MFIKHVCIPRNTLSGFQQTISSFTALRDEGVAPPGYSSTVPPPPRPQEPPRQPPPRPQAPRSQEQRKRPAEQTRDGETSWEREQEEEEEERKPDQVSTKIAKGITVGKCNMRYMRYQNVLEIIKRKGARNLILICDPY